jgi:acetyl esterase/lipase
MDARNPVLDLSYGSHPSQCLDLYLPADPEPSPLVMLIHGGAWSVGDKSQYAAVGVRLAQAGFLVAIINYRLSPAVQHPTHARDTASAVAWCYRHAAHYGADASRCYLVGHSSGAHLASLIALDESYLAAEGLERTIIQGVVGLSGAGYDLDANYASTMIAPYAMAVFGTDASRWRLAAPLHYVHADAPPFLLIHGLSDHEAPPAATERMAAALSNAGVDTQLHILPAEDHISVVFAAEPLVLAFLTASRSDTDSPERSGNADGVMERADVAGGSQYR